MIEIKFCENNFTHGTEKLANELKENYDNVDVQIEGCLGFCGDCAEGPYALVDGEFIQAESVEELRELIKEQLD